jgi:hypothetical protein
MELAMAFVFTHLDATTRPLMLSEIDLDVTAASLYVSDRLNPSGQACYAALLREAARSHDETWLAQQLRIRDCFNLTYQRRKPTGGFTDVRMPSNAQEMLAEGEFNRFYIRGVCQRAINEGVTQLVVYRAKFVRDPRPESESKIGSAVSPPALLDDLRRNTGIDTALGLPAGPSSGLCVTFATVVRPAA